MTVGKLSDCRALNLLLLHGVKALYECLIMPILDTRNIYSARRRSQQKPGTSMEHAVRLHYHHPFVLPTRFGCMYRSVLGRWQQRRHPLILTPLFPSRQSFCLTTRPSLEPWFWICVAPFSWQNSDTATWY